MGKLLPSPFLHLSLLVREGSVLSFAPHSASNAEHSGQMVLAQPIEVKGHLLPWVNTFLQKDGVDGAEAIHLSSPCGPQWEGTHRHSPSLPWERGSAEQGSEDKMAQPGRRGLGEDSRCAQLMQNWAGPYQVFILSLSLSASVPTET